MVIVAEELAQRLRGRMRGTVLAEARLDRYTTFRIGGPATLLAAPLDREDLKVVLAFARAEGLPVHVLGGGSNTLVRDGGLRGMAIHLNALQALERRGEMVEAGAGVRAGLHGQRLCQRRWQGVGQSLAEGAGKRAERHGDRAGDDDLFHAHELHGPRQAASERARGAARHAQGILAPGLQRVDQRAH
ncbi:MAG: FAD-binding protein [candidate division NC10 bacterium]